MMQCPKCGHANSDASYFCTQCHQVLIHRCPACWHEQRAGGVCEKCRTNFALYWGAQLQHEAEVESRIEWDKFWARAWALVQLGFLPFIGLRGLLRGIVRSIAARFIAQRLSNR